MSMLRISWVAYQPHVVITHPELLGSSLVLRIPEFVRAPDGSARCCPGNVVWEEPAHEARLRYRWGEDEAIKRDYATDFWGEVRAGQDHVAFDVTMRNIGLKPHSLGVFLFCLQAGEYYRFHDYDGVRTYVRLADRWASVSEMEAGKFQPHRMCGYATTEGVVQHNLMAKTSDDGEWVLGIALDQPGRVSCNQQLWPSCIHANPAWRELAPGDTQTAHGKVYFFRGNLDRLCQRYRSDFRPTGGAGG